MNPSPSPHSVNPFNPHQSTQPNLNDESSLHINEDSDLQLSGDSPQQRHDNQFQGEEYLMLKIGKLMHELIKSKQRLYAYETYVKQMRVKNDAFEAQVRKWETEAIQLKEQLKEKNETIQELNERVSKLEQQSEKKSEQFKQLETKYAVLKAHDEELQKARQKEMERPLAATVVLSSNPEFLKLKKKNKELTRICKLLEQELREANVKMIEVEKKYQDNACTMALSNIHRLRDPTRSFHTNQQNDFQSRETTTLLQKFKDIEYRSRALSYSKNL